MFIARIGVCAVLVLLAGCASTTFKKLETREPVVVDGQGGAKVVVDGMEIWEVGEPPRKFIVVGFLDDERPRAILPMMRMKSEIVKQAKESGGHAVIEMKNQAQITGYSSTTFANVYGGSKSAIGSATTVTSPIGINRALYAVIRYVGQ